MPSRVYLDHNATCPPGEPARRAMAEILAGPAPGWGNASSPHAFGHRARVALEEARAVVAKLMGAEPREIVFVSGGTEADNLAILGGARGAAASGKGARHVVTTAVEHPAVLESCRALQREGWLLTVLPVDRAGVVDPDDLARALAAEGGASLVSVMAANNESGVMQPVAELSRIAREAGALFHCDAVQGAGRVPIDEAAAGADLLSVSAHKMGGPAGIGALRVREGVPLEPILRGGGQERRRRAGTEAPILAAGFAAAGRAARERLRAGGAAALAALRDRMEKDLMDRIDGARVNGARAPRLPNTTSLTIPGVGNETLVIRMDMMGFAISTGSACSTGSARPSHVLAAMGLPPGEAACTIRISLGPDNTTSEIDAFVEALAGATRDLRAARAAPSSTVPAGRR